MIGSGLILSIFLVISALLVFWVFYTPKKERELRRAYRKQLEQSLDDEFIYDPATGVRITLDQAESGHWIDHDNHDRIKSEEEIEKLFSDEEKLFERVLNRLKESADFTYQLHEESLSHYLLNSAILKKYSGWTYYSSFIHKSREFRISIVNCEMEDGNYYEGNIVEHQLMLVANIINFLGHYTFKPKTQLEGLFDNITSDDEIDVDGFECFTITSSPKSIELQNYIAKFPIPHDFDFEIKEHLLIAKSTRFLNLNDLNDLITLGKTVANISS